MANGNKNIELIYNSAPIDESTFNSIKNKIDSGDIIIPLYCGGYKNYTLNPEILKEIKNDKTDLNLSERVIETYEGLIKTNKIESNPSAVKLTHEDYTILNNLNWDILNVLSKVTVKQEKGWKDRVKEKILGKENSLTKTIIQPSDEGLILEIINGKNLQKYTNNSEKFLSYLKAIDQKIKSQIEPLPDDQIDRAKKYFKLYQTGKLRRVKDSRYNDGIRIITPEGSFERLYEYVVSFASDKEGKRTKAKPEEIKFYYNLAKQVNEEIKNKNLELENLDLEMKVMEKAYENKVLDNKLQSDITYAIANEIVAGLSILATTKTSFEFDDVKTVLSMLPKKDIRENIAATLIKRGFEDTSYSIQRLLLRLDSKLGVIDQTSTEFQKYQNLAITIAEAIKLSSN